MRRSTLAPVSASSLNARGALTGTGGASRGAAKPASNLGSHGGPGKHPLSNRRSSMSSNPRHSVGSSNGRLSSTDFRRSSALGSKSGTKPDPRPVTDKLFMNNCCKNLIQFLTENGYDRPISLELLRSPTAKEFENIFVFLLRKMDQNYAFEGRVDEEVPRVMRALGFPLNVSKSALQVVGSSHTWPALLGVLSWLLELCYYAHEAMGVKQTEGAKVELENDYASSEFFEYTSKAYSSFMNGGDDFSVLDLELESLFAEKDRSKEQKLASAANEVQDLESEKEKLVNEEDPVVALTSRNDLLEGNCEKLKVFLKSLEEHEDVCFRKNSERELECQEFQAELDKMKSTNEAHRQTIADQESKGLDVNRLGKDRAVERGNLAMLAEKRAAVEARQEHEEQRMATQTGYIDEAINSYHEKCAALDLTPLSAKNSGGRQFRIALSRDLSVSDPSCLVSLDLRGEVLPYAEMLRESSVGERQEEKERSLALEKQIDQLAEDLRSNEESIGHRRAVQEKEERELERRQAQASEQRKVNAMELKSIEDDTASIKTTNDSTLRNTSRALEAVMEKYNTLRREYHHDLERWYQRLSHAIDVAVDYKRHVQDVVTIVTDKMNSLK